MVTTTSPTTARAERVITPGAHRTPNAGREMLLAYGQVAFAALLAASMVVAGALGHGMVVLGIEVALLIAGTVAALTLVVRRYLGA